jgi:AbrB family looped-hinge helix DNA binding protein
MNTRMSAKGQITVPKFARDALDLKPGSIIMLHLAEGELRLGPAPEGVARRLAGSLRRYARPGTVRRVRAEVKRKVGRVAAAEGASPRTVCHNLGRLRGLPPRSQGDARRLHRVFLRSQGFPSARHLLGAPHIGPGWRLGGCKVGWGALCTSNALLTAKAPRTPRRSPGRLRPPLGMSVEGRRGRAKGGVQRAIEGSAVQDEGKRDRPGPPSLFGRPKAHTAPGRGFS